MFFKLIFRNLIYYRRQNLALFFGVLIATATLTGALLVGDSVRESLVSITLQRLGNAKFAVTSGEKIFTQHLADCVEKQMQVPVYPFIRQDAVVLNTEKNTIANQANIIGVESDFFSLWKSSFSSDINENEAYINDALAKKLNCRVGEELLFKVQPISRASQNAPFVSQKQNSINFRLIVTKILRDSEGARFSLLANQQSPLNIFVSKSFISNKLNINGFINGFLISSPNVTIHQINNIIQSNYSLEDVGLILRTNPDKSLLTISSERIFLEEAISSAIQSEFPESQRVLTWLVNNFTINQKSTPYSFVSAVDSNFLDFSNLKTDLSDNDIIINQWLANDLSCNENDSITLHYYKIGALRGLTEASSRFKVKYIVPTDNNSKDSMLMPNFPGITQASNCRDWDAGIPVNLKAIRDKDEEYWKKYKGQPKAYISFHKGKLLWGNAFGNTTAFRIKNTSSNHNRLQTKILRSISPSFCGFSVSDVYSQGMRSALNSVDFGELFLSLSFFILLAAFLLIAVLIVFQLQQRKSELGLFSALGFSKKSIFYIYLVEFIIISLIACFCGVCLGVFYNQVVLWALNTLWIDAVNTSELRLSLHFSTLFYGFIISFLLILFLVIFLINKLLRKQLIQLINKTRHFSYSKKGLRGRVISFLFCLGVTICLLVYFATFKSINPEFFMALGAFVLFLGIFLFEILLYWGKSIRTVTLERPFIAILKSISYYKRRNLAVVSLLALGTFTILLTAANRKAGVEITRSSGTGAFLFWGETTLPILHNLNTIEGKQKYNLSDESVLQGVNFVQLFRLVGNEASCLNLNQINQPSILGVPSSYFQQEKAFSFLSTVDGVLQDSVWNLLENKNSDSIINAVADQSVITWQLKRKLGDTLVYTNDRGRKIRFRLVAGLENSIFQGYLLISAKNFQHEFPSVTGSKIMLVEGNFSKSDSIASILENIFTDFGLSLVSTSEKLLKFNAVENTYLSIFMILGALGVLIGTFGLGFVFYRILLERQNEIAVLQSIGYTKQRIEQRIYFEFFLIVLWGIFSGIFSALVGIFPTILSPHYSLPSSFVFVLLGIVILNAFAWVFFSVQKALSRNMLSAMRNE